MAALTRLAFIFVFLLRLPHHIKKPVIGSDAHTRLAKKAKICVGKP